MPELSISKKTSPHGRWGQGPGSVDPRFPAGLPFPVLEILEFVAFRDSGKISSNFPGTFPEFPSRRSWLEVFNLDRTFQSRSKISIPRCFYLLALLVLQRTQKGSIENFNPRSIARNFKSRRSRSNFFNPWALWALRNPPKRARKQPQPLSSFLRIDIHQGKVGLPASTLLYQPQTPAPLRCRHLVNILVVVNFGSAFGRFSVGFRSFSCHFRLKLTKN